MEAWKGERDGKGSVSRGTMQRIWQRTNLSREGLDADPQHLQSDPRAVSGMLADKPDDTSPSLRVPYTGELTSETGDERSGACLGRGGRKNEGFEDEDGRGDGGGCGGGVAVS